MTAIDVAGAGGTSWSQVEMHRIGDESSARVAAAFRGWGIPTAESIQQVRAGAPELIIFASGGLNDGIDIAKCISLGARLGGMAGLFLKAAVISEQAISAVIEEIRKEIRVCMFVTGAANLDQLQRVPLIKAG